MMAGIELPHRTVRANIGEALNYMVHIERRQGIRRVAEVVGVLGYEAQEDHYELQPLYP